MTTTSTIGPSTEVSAALAAAQSELRSRQRQLAQDAVGRADDEVLTADRQAVLAAERAVTAARQQSVDAGTRPGTSRVAGARNAEVIATSLTAAIAGTTAQRIALAHAQPAMAPGSRGPAGTSGPATVDAPAASNSSDPATT